MYRYKAVIESQTHDSLVPLVGLIDTVIATLKTTSSSFSYLSEKKDLVSFLPDETFGAFFSKVQELIDEEKGRKKVFNILLFIKFQAIRRINVVTLYVHKSSSREVRSAILLRVLSDVKADSSSEVNFVELQSLSGKGLFCACYKGLFVKYSISNLINKLIKTGYNKSIWRVIEKI